MNTWHLNTWILVYMYTWTGGGEDKKTYLDEVLEYDSRSNKWTKVGRLAGARRGHAVSLVPAAVEDQCIFDLGGDCPIVS